MNEHMNCSALLEKGKQAQGFFHGIWYQTFRYLKTAIPLVLYISLFTLHVLRSLNYPSCDVILLPLYILNLFSFAIGHLMRTWS